MRMHKAYFCYLVQTYNRIAVAYRTHNNTFLPRAPQLERIFGDPTRMTRTRSPVREVFGWLTPIQSIGRKETGTSRLCPTTTGL